MAGENWTLLWIVLLVCLRAQFLLAGFSALPSQSQLWTAYLSHDLTDCNGPGQNTRFPGVYILGNGITTFIDTPVNLTTSYVLKKYRRSNPRLYPGIMVEFSPPQHGSEHVTGYEIVLTKQNGGMCLVLALEPGIQAQQEKIQLELYPLSSETYFRVHATSLPFYDEIQKTEESRIMTGKDGLLPQPVLWVASVTYEVTRRAQERWLEMVFSSPPPQFRFRRFEVALLPTDNRVHGIQIETIEACFHTFKNVSLGQYKLQIRPVDDFFSVQGRCRCHYLSGACSTCVTTEVPGLIIS